MSSLQHQNKSWENITEKILDYLNAKIPDVPEITRQEIAVHFSSTMAITVYDAYEGCQSKTTCVQKRAFD